MPPTGTSPRAESARRRGLLRVNLCLTALVLVATALAGPKAGTAAKKARITRPTLYIVGYSHLDTEWCWSYPQVIREFIPNTLHDNFELFEKYPGYVFNWTGSNRYRFMKEYYPADYARLKHYISTGQWFPAGSSIEEGDVNAPSGESLIRQVMYGNEFFRKEFGIASDEFMLPDCFGFPASLPTVLAHCGIKGFSTQKLTWGSAVGIPFNVGVWKGTDGESVVAALNPGSYGASINTNPSTDTYWVDRVERDAARDGVPADYRYYGTGDRGGAPDERSVKEVEAGLHSDGPLHISAGRADQMFNDLSPDQVAQLPVYKGDLELTQHSAGSLTSEAEMKRWNRENEVLGDETERASVAADLLGSLPYDKDRITDAWLRFLPGQFHDLMAGTALPVAYNYTWNDEVIAMNEFTDVMRSAVGGVSRGLDTRVKGVPLVVYNPLSIARQDVVEADVTMKSPDFVAVRVVDPSGRMVPSQVEQRSGDHVKLLFLASLPSVGFKTYAVQPTRLPIAPSGDLKVSRDHLENKRYRVSIDGNADVSSIFDKSIHKELLSGPARLAYQHENPNDYPAWNMDWKDQKLPPQAYVSGPSRVRIVENGPVRVALQITRHFEGSTFVQTVRLSAGQTGDRVEFATRIDWRGKETALKAVFPLTASNPVATYNWGPGTVERRTDGPKLYEMASHQWFDLTDLSGDYGTSVLDDTKQGSDKPDDHTLRLTLLYTPGTAGGYQHQGTQDWGRHEMLYSLLGHAGNWRVGNTQWEADRMNQPLRAFQTVPHPGPLGRSWSLLSVSSPNVSVGALKMAEDGNEIVLRLNELLGQKAPGTVVSFAAPIASAREVDGQERPLGPAKVVNGKLLVDMDGYHPRAFAIRLAKRSNELSAPVSKVVRLPFNASVMSTGIKKADGNFDGHGRSIPGELLPRSIVSDGVTFRFGAPGGNNAVVCQGQTVAVPAGTDRTLYVVGSSAGGDTEAVFGVGSHQVPVKVQAWNGFIGQWDNRLWGGQVPELTYDWHNPLVGLQPGFIKRAPVVWYADHRRLADGSDDIYKFCYLFRYAIPIPNKVSSIVLPRNDKVRILAATVSENRNDATTPTQPLYDVLDRTGTAGPTISPAGGSYNDSVEATIGNSFYWSPTDTLHYTVDGTEPGPESPKYTGPISIRSTETLKVVEIDDHGHTSPVTTARFDVNDTTAPSVVTAKALAGASDLTVKLSEQVQRADAENPADYKLTPAETVTSAKLADDGRTVTLSVQEPFKADATYDIQVDGVRDLSPNANPSKAGLPVTVMSPVVSIEAPKSGLLQRDASLPTKAGAPWTINFFTRMDSTPQNLSVIAGFGDGMDNGGAERFMIADHGHIYFWGSGIDIDSHVPYDLNTWQMVTATYDGTTVRLFKNGQEIAHEAATFSDAAGAVLVSPTSPWDYGHLFKGQVRGLTVWSEALSPLEVAALYKLDSVDK